MNLRIVTAALLLSLATPGCLLANMTPETKLRDAVVGYNDECRWNRLDLAVQRVSPEERMDFYASHHQWGEDIKIADSDIVAVHTSGEDMENAMSLVQVQWYNERTMLLARTTIAQTWDGNLATGYVLVKEEVHSGNPQLLEPPDLPETEEVVEDEEELEEHAAL